MYIYSKMEHFSYKDECSMTCINAFKRRAVAWGTYKLVQVINNIRT